MSYKTNEIYTELVKALCDLYPKRESENITNYIIEDFFGKKNPATCHDCFTSEQIDNFLRIKNELMQGKPWQYITGYADFYGLKLKVNDNVLIPRPETEELVHLIIQKHKEKKSILDIGTGSGCIAIALAMHERFQLTALDYKESILNIAIENATINNVNIDFIKFDILNYTEFRTSNKFDIIVSNPPYITKNEKNKMHKNVLEFEPHSALFVTDNDELQFYKVIADFAELFLKNDGFLYFEVNQYHAQQTADALFEKQFKNIKIIDDFFGNERIISAQKK